MAKLQLIDESDYIGKVEKLLSEGPYTELDHDPLDNLVKEVD